ncbi:hypothetical protein JW968_07145 [Candidatus Woesearchaeota archaeon]|nr:hypothetical protein [Candidatus Woesearchaeota archaeon]
MDKSEYFKDLKERYAGQPELENILKIEKQAGRTRLSIPIAVASLITLAISYSLLDHHEEPPEKTEPTEERQPAQPIPKKTNQNHGLDAMIYHFNEFGEMTEQDKEEFSYSMQDMFEKGEWREAVQHYLELAKQKNAFDFTEVYATGRGYESSEILMEGLHKNRIDMAELTKLFVDSLGADRTANFLDRFATYTMNHTEQEMMDQITDEISHLCETGHFRNPEKPYTLLQRAYQNNNLISIAPQYYRKSLSMNKNLSRTSSPVRDIDIKEGLQIYQEESDKALQNISQNPNHAIGVLSHPINYIKEWGDRDQQMMFCHEMLSNLSYAFNHLKNKPGEQTASYEYQETMSNLLLKISQVNQIMSNNLSQGSF